MDRRTFITGQLIMPDLIPQAKQQFTSSAGAPLVGGKLYTYAAGTSTPKATYSDASGLVPNTNPVVLDSRGEATIFWSGTYKVTLTDSTGATIWTVDNIQDTSSSLADTSSIIKGDALIGVKLNATGATARTQHEKNADVVNLTDFSGADPTGVSDSTAAINNALSYCSTNKAVLHAEGLFKFSSTVTIPTGVRIVGAGYTSDSASSGRAKTCFLKAFNGTGIVVGDSASIEHCQVDGTGYAGDNVQLSGTRPLARQIASTNAGQDGIRIGSDVSVANTNGWMIDHCVSLNNGRHGLYVNDSVGSEDANAGVFIGGDYRNNAGDGIKVDSAAWNTFIGVMCQYNTGYGFRLTANARSTTIVGGDIEGNTAGQGVIEANSFGHNITSPFYSSTVVWVDNSGYRDRNTITQYYYTIPVASNGSNLIAVDPTAGAGPKMSLYGDTNLAELVRLLGAQTGTNGSRAILYTKIDGGSPAQAMVWDMLQRTTARAAFVQALTVLTYSASITADASLGNLFQISVSNGTAFTINAPTNPSTGQEISICIRNVSGGAMGAITWNAVFKLAGWSNPANGFSRTITFRYDGANWVMHQVSGADVPN